jgi:hypothetical protein
VTVRGLSVPILIGLAMVALILAFLSALAFSEPQVVSALFAGDQQAAPTQLPAGDLYIYGKR